MFFCFCCLDSRQHSEESEKAWKRQKEERRARLNPGDAKHDSSERKAKSGEVESKAKCLHVAGLFADSTDTFNAYLQ